jgi:hypothetical protein
VRFVLEVEMDGFGDAAVREVERILRYWGGNLRHYGLVAGDEAAVTDSEYREVGAWRVVDGGE